MKDTFECITNVRSISVETVEKMFNTKWSCRFNWIYHRSRRMDTAVVVRWRVSADDPNHCSSCGGPLFPPSLSLSPLFWHYFGIFERIFGMNQVSRWRWRDKYEGKISGLNRFVFILYWKWRAGDCDGDDDGGMMGLRKKMEGWRMKWRDDSDGE